MNFQLATSTLGATFETNGAWTLWDIARNERLLILPALPICAPVLAGIETTAAGLVDMELGSDFVAWRYEIPGVSHFTARLAVEGENWLLSSSFVPHGDQALTRLDVLPAESGINLYDVVNFRNRHFNHHTWPELFLGAEGGRTDTYSRDWQFAPHPSLLTFRKGRRHLLLGALDLSPSFGLHFAVRENKVSEFYLDFGAAPHALPLKGGQLWESPRFVLFGHEADDVHETIARFGAELVRFGLIPDPGLKSRFAWHQEPLYFSWVDQAYRAESQLVSDLMEQAKIMEGGDRHILTVLDEGLIREAAATIRREALPIRTILIDDGWQIARGQWQPHLGRFPDLRGLVDELHGQGFKVGFWWSWAEILDKAEIEPETLLTNPDGTPWRNRHGARVRDYSHPATQEYLRGFFRTMFSSEAGCFDFDAVKTDFLADKVHPDMPLFDPAWRGEENYMLRLTHLFFEEMRRHKSDACHIGCAGDPFLAQYIDINRTYDVFSTDVREHLNRGRMLLATAPGVPVAFDSHNFIEGYADYFAVAAEAGYSVQLSNILRQQHDYFSTCETAGPELYDVIRDGLKGV